MFPRPIAGKLCPSARVRACARAACEPVSNDPTSVPDFVQHVAAFKAQLDLVQDAVKQMRSAATLFPCFILENCLSRSVTTFMSNDMPNCMHQNQINFRFYFIPYQMQDRKSNIDTKHYMSIR